MQKEPPTDVRWIDGRCWQSVKAPTPESQKERSVVVRKHPHDDRREARGKPGRSLRGQEFDVKVVDSCRVRDVP